MGFLKEFIDAVKFLFAFICKIPFCCYRPFVVVLEPTNNCNLKCVMCSHPTMKREKGFMPRKLFQKIIQTNNKFIRRLDLHMLGEPLLHKEIPLMIRYSRYHGIKTRMYTNATMLDEQLTRDIMASGLDVIIFSFEGANREKYDRIRIGAKYDETLQKIDSFIRVRNQLKQKNLLVYVEFVDSFFTREENKDFVKKMKDLGVDRVSSVPIHNWPGIIKFGKKNKKSKKKKVYPCFIPWVNLTVLWDGKVVGCCDDFEGVYIVGDLGSNPSMEKIWNSEKMMQLRTHHIKKTASMLSPCAECDRLTKFPFSYNILRQGAWFLLENL